jgi:hypothetical protein
MTDAELAQRLQELQETLRQIGVVLSRLGQQAPSRGMAVAAGAGAALGPALGNRRLVYVHGICAHPPGYSDPWWAALQPFVDDTFGAGLLGQTRLEVLWSDVVTSALGRFAAAAPAVNAQQARAAAEIREVMLDRADRHALEAGPKPSPGTPPLALADARGFLSIPDLDCVEDFTIYLVNDTVRQEVIDRFTQVVKPLLTAQLEIDVISHSWGTVVAYEGLRQLEDGGLTQPQVHNFFTVGAALSIAPVKMRLRPANQDGRRPAMVRRWVNLNAQGDVVGGPLQGRPFQVDDDFPNLVPYGCGSFVGIVNPVCAHGSYFKAGNIPVNRDIFGAFIEQP